MTTPPLKARDRDAILQSLRAGVVPSRGHQHIQVGRAAEVHAVMGDIDRIAQGGSAIRFVVDEYGSGKTFFLSLVRAIALERKLVVANADLSPQRRLHGTGGQARSLYAELMRNLSTRATPDGGATPNVVERFVTTAMSDASERGVPVKAVIAERLEQLTELVGGYDFATVIGAYWDGHDRDDPELQSAAVRWLRGEYATRTDARLALGVRTIVEDRTVYDHLKLMARFVRLAGFGGLYVVVDELVNLYKISNTVSRNANYEEILRILNDALQGNVEGLGFAFGATPETLMDPRRGLYSYPALQSRLAENTFATGALVDYTGPVLRLANLTQEDFYVLLGKLRHVYANGDESGYLIGDDGITSFMQHCSGRIGDAYFRTPRTTIKEFINLLAVLDQNRDANWTDLLGRVDLAVEANPDLEPIPDTDPPVDGAPTASGPASADGTAPGDDDDDLASFRL